MLFFTASFLLALATGATAKGALDTRSLTLRSASFDPNMYCNISNTDTTRTYTCNYDDSTGVEDCKMTQQGGLTSWECPVGPSPETCDEEFRPARNEFVASCNTDYKFHEKCVQAKSGDRWENSCPIDVVFP